MDEAKPTMGQKIKATAAEVAQGASDAGSHLKARVAEGAHDLHYKADAAGGVMKHKAEETSAGIKSDAHQEAAKDSSLGVGTRLQHGIGAAKDKVKEVFHSGQKEVDKEKFKS